MCGIAGFLQTGLDPAQARALATAMTSRIAHRGPDGEDLWHEGDVTLGHRRLAIVDLSPTGAQPMHSASGRYVIVFNGEIYNHEELRPELERAGVAFRGTSDTEVLLALMDARGVRGAIDAAVGMFAFAVWDRRTHTLTLARDRMGEKPLYYGWTGEVFLFGSELKALRAHPSFQATIDPTAVGLLLRWAYVPAPWSIFLGIQKLRAGELLELQVQPGSGPLRARCRQAQQRYWRIEDRVADGLTRPFAGSFEDAVDALEERLATAVRLQLRSDVPLGAFLSGGIDSSLVVAQMQRQAAHTARTFSIGFDEPGFDESGHARQVATHLETRHTEFRVTPAEARAVIPQLPHMFDEPFADASQMPTYLVAKLAREHVTVSLSGDGGDELFGGYGKYAVGSRLATLPARRLLAALLRSSPALGAAHFASATAPSPRTKITPRRLSRLSQMLAAEPLELARMLSDNCPDFADLLPRTAVAEPVDDLRIATNAPYGVVASLLDIRTYLPDDVLTKVDRASMAVSLESRAPLLDHRLVEFACRLPWSMRAAGTNKKKVLRQLLYRYVPKPLVDRPKMGFSVPIASWLRKELRPWAEELIAGKAGRDDVLIDRNALQARWVEHQERRADRSPMLWAALMYLAWRAQET
ncbi:MAG TPA: asparagine synthase (glutamine-hydrolyzing) [Burkholderiaceae bacterium]|nr:asparagine synthase (glutamine-hydrolyzing) [Burkholderiaceae bacterium]